MNRSYGIFVAKNYDYALIDNFWGFPRFIDSPTSYATLAYVKPFWLSFQYFAAHLRTFGVI